MTGLDLYVEEAGQGGPPIVFLHPAASDHTFFAPQATEFSATHRVVTVDQRGFGASGRLDGHFRPADFADDVARLCEQLKLERPLVVGSSMGGGVAIEFAARHPDLPCGIAILNRPVTPTPAVDSTIRKLAEMLRGPSATEAVEMLVTGQFGPLDPPELKEEYRGTAMSTSPHVLASCLEGFLTWDGAAALAAVRVPALFTFPHTAGKSIDVEAITQLCRQAVIGRTVGAGHFENRTVPDQINPMIKRFLEVFVTP